MKKVIIFLISFLLTSCASSVFYQVYKTTPCENEKIESIGYVYEDSNCMVFYDFWCEGGNIGFKMYNKTNENLYLNLDESYFIRNGMAHDYFLNRTYSNSSSIGVSNSKTSYYTNSLSQGYMTVSGQTISNQEKRIICIPPKTYKLIQEYTINNTLYRFCNMLLYPNKKLIDTLKFTLSESPIIFGNKIAYSLGNSDKLIRVENNFYVSEITNYPEEIIKTWGIDYFCESDIIGEDVYYFKNESPLFFYHKYYKNNNYKH